MTGVERYDSRFDSAFTSSRSSRTFSVVLQLAVARFAFARKLHKLRASMFRIVDEFDKLLGRKLIRQPLHALRAGGSHLGDLRHGQRALLHLDES
jgi:hypothetical protein